MSCVNLSHIYIGTTGWQRSVNNESNSRGSDNIWVMSPCSTMANQGFLSALPPLPHLVYYAYKKLMSTANSFFGTPFY